MVDPTEFARVISCDKCSVTTSRKLLRDDMENVPQPGFIGAGYIRTRVALAGQNPGVCPPRFAHRDARYTAALRALRDTPDHSAMTQLYETLLDFIPEWPIHGNYFPLSECGLQLEDIAYFNVVRCRTVANAAPGTGLVRNCLEHFDRWLALLKPRVLVFIGKWAHDHAAHLAAMHGIPVGFMNRERSLSAIERNANREAIVALVRGAV